MLYNETSRETFHFLLMRTFLMLYFYLKEMLRYKNFKFQCSTNKNLDPAGKCYLFRWRIPAWAPGDVIVNYVMSSCRALSFQIPRVVLRISSDVDDPKDFFGFEIRRLFWLEKFGNYLSMWFDFIRDFGGTTIWRSVIHSARVSQPRSSANKVIFSDNFKTRRLDMAFFRVNFWFRHFWGF